MRPLPRSFRRLALLIAALPLLAPGARAEGPDDPAVARLPGWTWETTPAHRTIATALRESRRDDAPPARELVDRILAAGPGSLAAELDILVHKRVPEASPEDAPQILSEPQRALLLAALARTPAPAVRAAVLARVEGALGDVDTHLAAIHALGAIGDAGDVRRIVELVPPSSSPDHPLSNDARQAVKAACAAILLRDRGAYSSMGDLIRRIDPAIGRSLLDALGSRRDPRALEILRNAARAQPSLRAQVAALAAKCGGSTDPLLDREFTAWAESELKGARPEYARSLLQAMGTLDDGTCVPAMIARLEDPDAGVRDSALWALRKVSGLGFPGLSASWTTWHLAEVAWLARAWPRLQQDLASRDARRMVLALRGYSGHRTRRAELSSDVEKVLSDRRAALRRLACEVLEQLGSMSACPALLVALEDHDRGVAGAARRALQGITGLDVPEDPALARGLVHSP